MKKIKTIDKTPQIPSFLQGFNRRWYANNCVVVYLCYSSDGVKNALEEATSLYGGGVKIKCGGHCYENFVFNNETKAIIDVTAINNIGYDQVKGYYLDGGGTNWDAFKTLFRDYGKVLPAGSCYSVGLGGHICGGGYGLLSRLNGLTIDWLTGVEIVVKEGDNKLARTIYVSKDSEGSEQDLFWAQCGGGGGNFGVITRYYFKELPDSPNTAFITTYAFAWENLTVKILMDILEWYEIFAKNDYNWNQFGLLKLNHQSNGEIHLIIQTAVDDNETSLKENELLIKKQSKELAQICKHREAQSPIIGHSGHFNPVKMGDNIDSVKYTYYEATQTLNGSGPNQRGKYKSAYMRKGFTEDDVRGIFDFLSTSPPYTDKSMKQCLLQIDSYGGKINTVDSKATAIAQRDSIFKLQYQAYWEYEDDDSFFLSWIRNFYSSVYQKTGGTPDPELDPTNNVDGCYYNYPDADLNDIVGREGAMKLYFLNNLERLKLVKRSWDPNNYFNNAQSIPL